MTLVLLQTICGMQKPTGGRSYGYISAADSASGNREIDPDQAKIVLKYSSSPRKAFGQVHRRPISSTNDLRQTLSAGAAFSGSSAVRRSNVYVAV
jgi:hypothetical protein